MLESGARDQGSEKPQITCDLHRLPSVVGQVIQGTCVYFDFDDGRKICRHKNGPLFCITKGKASRELADQELQKMRVSQ